MKRKYIVFKRPRFDRRGRNIAVIGTTGKINRKVCWKTKTKAGTNYHVSITGRSFVFYVPVQSINEPEFKRYALERHYKHYLEQLDRY